MHVCLLHLRCLREWHEYGAPAGVYLQDEPVTHAHSGRHLTLLSQRLWWFRENLRGRKWDPIDRLHVPNCARCFQELADRPWHYEVNPGARVAARVHDHCPPLDRKTAIAVVAGHLAGPKSMRDGIRWLFDRNGELGAQAPAEMLLRGWLDDFWHVIDVARALNRSGEDG